jgi:hypothetical protein
MEAVEELPTETQVALPLVVVEEQLMMAPAAPLMTMMRKKSLNRLPVVEVQVPTSAVCVFQPGKAARVA